MKTVRKNRFTLVELLAAIAVFCVLLLVSMRLFSGSQQLWVRSEQKTNTFADARTAMEFISSRLQTLVYFEDMPFGMAEDEIWFVSNFPAGRANDSGKKVQDFWYFTKFERNPYTGCLTMKIFGADTVGDKTFYRLLPPFLKVSHAKSAWERVQNRWRTPASGSGSAADHTDIIENVVDFKLTGYFAYKSGKEWKIKSSHKSLDSEYYRNYSAFDFYDADHNLGSGEDKNDEQTTKSKKFFVTPPYLVEVELTILDSGDHYEEWKDANAARREEIVSQYGYTFRRAILLGQRSVDE